MSSDDRHERQQQQHHSVYDYTVACICPLGVELAAVEGMLDHIHEPIRASFTYDRNAYTLGEIGGHYIVVAVLPEIGNNKAAAVATQLLNDFPCIRFGLLVGIGGGVPGAADVRLGDIVIGVPEGISNGVVQYDLGKKLQDGSFLRTGSLNKPPQVLLSSVRKLEAQYRRCGQDLSSLVSAMIREYPNMEATYSFPETTRDDLFYTSYVHTSGIDCGQCDLQQTVQRAIRPNTSPQIHYGTIGSANTVVKDASVRDQLRTDQNILCVEMEAAGLMDDFPCLVVRGICDYADSHKNKSWQPYAAATAAAYMKNLLMIVPVQQVLQTRRISDVAQPPSRLNYRLRQANLNSDLQTPDMEFRQADRSQAVYDMLSYEGMDARVEQISLQNIPSASFEWVWSTSFKKWLNQAAPFYWITGKPGSGKSTLMQYLTESPKTKKALSRNNTQHVILHFFFDFRAGQSAANNESGLIKWFITQMCNHDDQITKRLGSMSAFNSNRELPLNQLLDIFCNILENRPTRICAFVDGLDEYTGDFDAVVQLLMRIQNRTSIKMCLASRPEPAFERLFKDIPRLTMQEYNQASVRVYLEKSIDREKDRTLDIDTIFDDALRQQLLDRANGVIVWARLAIDELLRVARTTPSRDHLLDVLHKLPEDLEVMYDRTFSRIPKDNAPEAALIMFIINAFGGTIDLPLLHQIYGFLKADVYHRGSKIEPVNEDDLVKRLQVLLGSFVDFIDSGTIRNEKARENGPSSVALGLAARARQFWRRTQRRQVIQVRLMHKTLQPYLQRSTLVKECLPPQFRIQYMESMRCRLYASVIDAATSSQFFDLDSMNRLIQKEEQNKTLQYWSKDVCRLKMTALLRHSSPWASWLDLLILSIFDFPRVAHEQHDFSPDTLHVWQGALRSPFMFFELQCVLSTRSAAGAILRDPEHMDLVLAMRCELSAYVHEIILRGYCPASSVWNQVTLEFAMFMRRRLAPFGAMHDCPEFNLRRVRKLIEIIEPHLTAIPIGLLTYLYESSRRYSSMTSERGDKIVCELLTSMKGLPIDPISRSPHAPCECRCTAHLNHLVQSFLLDSRHVTLMLPVPESRNTLAHITRIMRANGCTLNDSCETAGTVMHRLVRFVSVGYSETGLLELVIFLARLGFNPSADHDRESYFRDVEQIKLRSLPFSLKPRHQELNKILAYQQEYGSWPEFSPIVQRLGLGGLASWEVDENGDLVLDEM